MNLAASPEMTKIPPIGKSSAFPIRLQSNKAGALGSGFVLLILIMGVQGCATTPTRHPRSRGCLSVAP